jgi:type II secretory pathway component GspD/PulD (secretin)
MKLKLIVLALMGAFFIQHSAVAQPGTDSTGTNAGWPTNSVAATNSSTETATTPAEAASGMVTNATSVAIDTNAPATTTPVVTAAPVATDTNVPAAAAAPTGTTAPVTPVASATPAAPVASAVPAETGEAAPAPVAPAPSAIPLIEFQDVPLTVAIENLARQAGINYLLDPKIGYGQADANGQVKTEPTLSIRWENVTAEQALLALLNNYDLQLVEDSRTKIARISMKDPSAPPALVTRVMQLKYASTSNMMASVEAAFTDRRSHVFPDVRTSQLIVVATANEQDAIDILVNQLDKPTRQVLIETKLVEIASTPSTSKGVNWSGTLAAQNVSFGNGVLQPSTSTKSLNTGTIVQTVNPGGGTGVPVSTSGNGVETALNTITSPSSAPGGLSWNTLSGFTPGIGFLNADGVQAVLSFLNSSYDAQVLSTPRVVTLDNEAAEISVTREFPVINVTASTAGVSSGSSQVNYSNIGTTLQVTPRITANDYIWLKVIPDVSSFFATVTKVIAGSEYQADEFDIRHIETQVMIPNNNTLVMGGLIQDNPTAQWYQVPLLGNIPVLGWAFKSEQVQMDKENLIIFITPTIVKDDDFQPSTSDFLASRPIQMKEQMNPNSAWDKPEPDWSNPAPSPGEFNYGSH